MKAGLFAAAVLVIASPLAAQTPNWSKGAPLSVTMTNKGFVPRRITMRPGGQYILRLRNPSDRAHTFQAKTFFAQARVSPRDQAWVANNEVELKPGRSATLHLIAPNTPRSSYTVRSTRILDAGDNFKGEILVR